MKIEDILQQGRQTWGNKPMTLDHIVAAMGVVYGDICRQSRNKHEKIILDSKELKKELGNIISSTIRWCDDLGYDPAEYITLSQHAQTAYQHKKYHHEPRRTSTHNS